MCPSGLHASSSNVDFKRRVRGEHSFPSFPVKTEEFVFPREKKNRKKKRIQGGYLRGRAANMNVSLATPRENSSIPHGHDEPLQIKVHRCAVEGHRSEENRPQQLDYTRSIAPAFFPASMGITDLHPRNLPWSRSCHLHLSSKQDTHDPPSSRPRYDLQRRLTCTNAQAH